MYITFTTYSVHLYHLTPVVPPTPVLQYKLHESRVCSIIIINNSQDWNFMLSATHEIHLVLLHESQMKRWAHGALIIEKDFFAYTHQSRQQNLCIFSGFPSLMDIKVEHPSKLLSPEDLFAF